MGEAGKHYDFFVDSQRLLFTAVDIFLQRTYTILWCIRPPCLHFSDTVIFLYAGFGSWGHFATKKEMTFNYSWIKTLCIHTTQYSAIVSLIQPVKAVGLRK